MQPELFSPTATFASIAEVGAALRGLGDDPLAIHGGQIVVSRGNPAARLMLIGEAPGAEEDRLGAPFVGRSGKLLDQILRSVELDPARDVFITNSVYRRPPENRKPMPAEVAYYRPFLLEILRLVDPRLVVLVGGVAALALLGEKRGISQIRGQWFDWQGRRAMPIFHPAYLLRNPSKSPGSPKALTWRDIKLVRAAFDELRAGTD